MTFDTAFLIQLLQELDQQITDVRPHAEALRAAFDRQDLGQTICAKLDAERHLRALALTTECIKARVIRADDLGTEFGSLSELVLRAIRIVVLTELDALRDIVSGPAARGRSRALFQGLFHSVDDLTGCVRDELHRIVLRWLDLRGAEGVSRTAYRDALRCAHAATRALGIDSDLASFLRLGVTRNDWPALEAVCTRMLAALTIRIDVEPDLPLLVPLSRSHTPMGGRAL
ncbi:MAG: hypothetical protein ABIY55_26400 [Kofleriaceae bacterium]